ncbi:SlyX family protein [Ketogulonicigenium vulgare]|uniref:SlyX family protein n=1 Tax=Ketogulonicigenium vulgare TaxID=92945 RepID=UPI002358DF8B|nr:SlyX family protein [Ketogulonicigenium vulgare]
MSTDNTQTLLEEKIAHLTRMVEDLSDVIHRQDQELVLLTRRVQFLIERDANREAELMDSPAADQRPPHW